MRAKQTSIVAPFDKKNIKRLPRLKLKLLKNQYGVFAYAPERYISEDYVLIHDGYSYRTMHVDLLQESTKAEKEECLNIIRAIGRPVHIIGGTRIRRATKRYSVSLTDEEKNIILNKYRTLSIALRRLAYYSDGGYDKFKALAARE